MCFPKNFAKFTRKAYSQHKSTRVFLGLITEKWKNNPTTLLKIASDSLFVKQIVFWNLLLLFSKDSPTNQLTFTCLKVWNTFQVNNKNTRMTPPNVFYKKRCLKNFIKFTGKHLCRSPFNKFAALKLVTLSNSATGLLLWILRNL